MAKGQSVLRLSSADQEKIVKAVQSFRGQGATLETALGALIVGQHYGWRVLKIIHGNRTYNKYQEILGVKFEDVCPERTEFSHKSVGLAAADRWGSFWAVVRGKRKVPDKGLIS